MKNDKGEILLYQTEDGDTKIDVRLHLDTTWLSLNQMAELFQRDKSVISRHIKNIFAENELKQDSVVAKFATTAADGKIYNVDYYNLDVVISVGYRVKSHRGTQFRIWATERLREYLIKGFTMNDDLLKKAGGGDYFDELLERIRDIRSSEKVFYRKILDIYSTSIDYDQNSEMSQRFFKTIQNKMHWAAHGHTAAEIVYLRADANKPFMGMTAFQGSRPTKAESGIAKNYLTQEELNILNRIVNAYLEFAELQATRHRTMTMREWILKLDDFLKMTDSEILTHAGRISHQAAEQKAAYEYEQYRQRTRNELSPVEKHFLESIEKTKKLLETKKKRDE